MSSEFELLAARLGVVGWLESRGDSMASESNEFLTQAATGSNASMSNQMLINQLKFAAAKSIRTSTIILATFNAVAAFATAIGILYDAYSRERRNNRSFKFTRSGFNFVPATDVFPLVLSIGIMIQSTTFAVAQSTGLDSLFGVGCTVISELMLPALFIAPYTQFMFGVEITIRALQKKPFRPRGKWTVTICMTIIGLLTLANFLIADFDRSIDFCFTSLFFFLAHYSVGCFAGLTAITSVLLICAVIIFVRLHRSAKIEVAERVAASRMVYYLALGVISNAFIVAYFFAMSFTDTSQGQGNSNALTLSMIASVVANVSGLMTGGLYLFLKSNTLSTIGPRDKIGEYERRKMKSQIRRYGTGDENDGSHMMQPIAGSRGIRRMDSDASLISAEKSDEETLVGERGGSPGFDSINPNPLQSNAAFPKAAVPRPPEAAQLSTSTSAAQGGHMRKRSYSLFPNNAPGTTTTFPLLPATTYSPNAGAKSDAPLSQADLDALKPPPSMGNLMNRHRRDSSMVSSATVQIGLRLSNVNDIMLPPMTINAKPPQTVGSAESVYSLECPDEKLGLAASKRPGPLLAGGEAPAQKREVIEDATPKRDPVKDLRMKTLPPVPTASVIIVDAGSSDSGSEYEDDEEEKEEKEAEAIPMTLSPAVYNPQSPTKARLPSPRGVGFTMIAKANSTGSTHPRSPRSPPVAPPRRTTGQPSPRPTETKDWI